MNEISYSKDHKPIDCDKCLKEVGKKHLTKVPFLYLDMNDKIHPDESIKLRKQYAKDLLKYGTDKLLATMFAEKKIAPGYRQYYICKECTP